MAVCRHCKHENVASVKFCVNCGKEIAEKEIVPDQASESSSDPSSETTPEKPATTSEKPATTSSMISMSSSTVKNLDRENLITIAGIVGILIIIIAVFSLLEPIIQQINLEQVIYLLLALGIILFSLGLYFIIKERLNDLSKILVVTTGEILILAIVYLFDIAYRSELTRYALLIVVVILFMIGLFLPQFRPMGLVGSAWQLGSVYLGFVNLISFGGSSYYSRYFFTATTLLVILSCHLAIFRSKSIYLLFWTIPLEFFTLFQSSVVNSTYLFFASIVIIGSLPILLYFYRDNLPQITAYGQNIFERALILPQVALVFTVTNGGLLAPQPEILTGLFLFIWIVYTVLLPDDAPKSSTTNPNSNIYTILIIALIGFTLSGQFLTSMVLFLAAFIAPIELQPSIEKLRSSMVLTSVVAVIAMFFLYLYRIELVFLYGIAIFSLVSHIGLTYYRYQKQVLELTQFYQIWLSVLTGFFLLVSFDFVILLPLNLAVHIIFSEIKEGPPVITSVMIAFPAIAAVLLAKDELYQWLVIGTQAIAILYTVFRNKQEDKSLDLAILILPMVFILSQVLDNFVVNAIILLMFISAVYLDLSSVVVDGQIMGSLLLVGSIILRDVAPSESGKVFSYEITVFMIVALASAFTLLHLFNQFVRKTTLHADLSSLGWFIAILYTLNYLQRNIYEEMQIIVFYSTMAILGLQLIYSRLRQSSPRLRVLIASFLFVLPVFFSTLTLYYLPWLVLAVIQLGESYIAKEEDTTIYHSVYQAILVINLFFILFVNNWLTLITLLVYLIILVYPGQFKSIVENYLSERLFISLVLGSGILVSLINGILRDITYFSDLQTLLLFGGSALILLGWLIPLSQSGMNGIFSVYFAFSSLYLLQISFLPFWFLVITLVSTGVALIMDKDLRKPYSGSLEEAVNSTTLAAMTVSLVLLIELGLLLISEALVGFQLYNRILVFVGLLLILAVIFLEHRQSRTYLTSSMLFLGSLIFVITTFFGFYEEVISNLLFSSLALITASLGVYFKREDIFRAGLGLSLLSVFKAVLDLLILDSFTRSISLLMVGIQLIFYVIVMSNLDEGHFTQATEDEKQDESMGEPEEASK